MFLRLFASVVFAGLMHTIAIAGEVPAIRFVDGRWSGGTGADPDNAAARECWASTTFRDGTTFMLAERDDGSWHLRLSNPYWRLPPFRRHDVTALVDFYPRLRFTAEAMSQTRLEIADLEKISLLGLIENGHTIDLASQGFNEKYELEGSAKIIARIRNCRSSAFK